jgi:hypothetical protein
MLARRLLDDIDRALSRPAPPPMRGSPFDLDDTDDALLAGNPSLRLRIPGEVARESAMMSPSTPI